MSWTAIVPLKTAADRKTRLSPSLAMSERIKLSESMAIQVISSLTSLPEIGRVLLLSPEPQDELGAEWVPDQGRELNSELIRVRAEQGGAVVVVHADLPLLSADEVTDLLMAADEAGTAIAPDRHGEGTNAIALADTRPFRFAFGPGSFRLHCSEGHCKIVRRPGLSFDIDTLCDLEIARAVGLLD